jgi:hypothetical protein
MSYKDRPDWDRFALRRAAKLFEIETKASVFLGYESGSDRDDWLEDEVDFIRQAQRDEY